MSDRPRHWMGGSRKSAAMQKDSPLIRQKLYFNRQKQQSKPSYNLNHNPSLSSSSSEFFQPQNIEEPLIMSCSLTQSPVKPNEEGKEPPTKAPKLDSEIKGAKSSNVSVDILAMSSLVDEMVARDGTRPPKKNGDKVPMTSVTSLNPIVSSFYSSSSSSTQTSSGEQMVKFYDQGRDITKETLKDLPDL